MGLKNEVGRVDEVPCFVSAPLLLDNFGSVRHEVGRKMIANAPNRASNSRYKPGAVTPLRDLDSTHWSGILWRMDSTAGSPDCVLLPVPLAHCRGTTLLSLTLPVFSASCAPILLSSLSLGTFLAFSLPSLDFFFFFFFFASNSSQNPLNCGFCSLEDFQMVQDSEGGV